MVKNAENPYNFSMILYGYLSLAIEIMGQSPEEVWGSPGASWQDKQAEGENVNIKHSSILDEKNSRLPWILITSPVNP